MSDTLTRGERNKLLKDMRAAGRQPPKLGYCVTLPADVAAKWGAKSVCRSYFPATRKLFKNSSGYYFAGARRSRKRRKPMTAAQLRDKLACKVFGGKACR